MSDEEARRKDEKPPRLSPDQVAALTLSRYGIQADASSVKELNSYDDRNYFLRDVATAQAYVLKIHNGVESDNADFLQAQNKMMAHLGEAGLPCQTVCMSLQGSLVEHIDAQCVPDLSLKRAHAVRLLTYLSGELMADVVQSPALLQTVGYTIGKMDFALKEFHSPALERVHLWDLANTMCLRDFVKYVDTDERKLLINDILLEFEERVLPLSSTLRRAVVHNDANDQNLLVDASSMEVAGILDFGDILVSWQVNEIAIAMAYAILGKDDPTMVMSYLLAGYLQSFPLTEDELRVLPTLVMCRLACSVVMGAYSHAMEPDNVYLLLTQAPGWKALEGMRAQSADHIRRAWMAQPHVASAQAAQPEG